MELNSLFSEKFSLIPILKYPVIFVDPENGSIVRMNIKLVRPLKTFGAGLNALKFSVDSIKQEDYWLISRVEVESEYKLFATFRKRNIWTYSDFKKLSK